MKVKRTTNFFVLAALLLSAAVGAGSPADKRPIDDLGSRDWSAALAARRKILENPEAHSALALSLAGPSESEAEALRLIAQLSHEDWRTREDATEKLKQMGPDIMPCLAEAASAPDTDPETSYRCGELLAALRETHRVDPAHTQPVRRIAAAISILAESGDAAWLDAILKHRQSFWPEVRLAVAEALERFADERAVKAAENLLEDEDWRVARRAIYSLAGILPARAAGILAGIASSPQRPIEVRAAALDALSACPGKENGVVSVCVNLLKDPHWLIRAYASRILRLLGAPAPRLPAGNAD